MIDDPKLLQFLQTEEARSVDNDLNAERQAALEFYRGDLFGDEVDGRSKLRTRDVAEVVDYMCISVMRTLVSGDKIVEFEPSEQGQNQLAQQATERVHWNFLREQDGYSILHDGIKAGLLEKSGVWKSWVERPWIEQSIRANTSELEAYDERVVSAQPAGDLYDVDQQTGEPLQVYDAVVRMPGKIRFRDASIPNDQFFCSPDTRTLPESPYVGDWRRQSLADLMAMGYPEDEVANLWGDNNDSRMLTDARDAGRSETESNVSRTDLSRLVVLREEYVRWPVEGRQQRVRVHRVGTTILSVEPVDDQPYTLWCPFPMQHRLIGQSLADKTMDIQVVRSHMLRQAMDALYIANAPRLYIDMSMADDTTLDDALDVAPGGVIRGRGPNAVSPFQQPFAAGHAFEAMEIMAGEKESRTGITRLNQGLDADTLNKTATGTALMQAQGQQIEEYVARNAANAIGEMFEKKLRLMISDMEPHEFRIDGEPQRIEPSAWPEDMRLGVRVGLGSGNKDKRLQAIQQLMQAQGEARALDPRMVTPEQAFATAKLLTGTLGLGLATQFFADPTTFQKGAQPTPDPALLEAQAKAQSQQFDQQLRQQESASKLQLQQAESAARLELDRRKAEAEMQLSRERMDAEMQLKREQMFYALQGSEGLPQNRDGGRLDA